MKHNKIFFLAIFGMVLIIALMGVMVGCGTNETVTNTVTAAAPTATATTTATATATTTTTAMATVTATAKPITIVFSTHDPLGGSWTEVFDPFFNEVEQRTGGMVRFEQHWGGELSGFFEAYDACATGQVDMAQTMCTMYPNIFPLQDISAIVDFTVNCLAESRFHTELLSEFPEMQQAYTNSGTKLIFTTSTFPSMMCMRQGVVCKTLDDFKGKKVLSTGPWDAATWEALSMVPTSMMPTETYLNLQTGVVDGATLTLGSLWDFGWGEVVPNITECNVRPGVFEMVMNLDKWNSIPAEYQKIIEEAAAKVPAAQDAQQLRFDRDLRPEAIKDWGTTFYSLSQADLEKMNELTMPVRTKFANDMNAKGLPGTKLVEEAFRLQRKYAGQEYALK